MVSVLLVAYKIQMPVIYRTCQRWCRLFEIIISELQKVLVYVNVGGGHSCNRKAQRGLIVYCVQNYNNMRYNNHPYKRIIAMII